MTLETRAQAVFDALAADDMEELGSHWAEDGIYNNPALGPAAVGKAAVVETVGGLSKGLLSRGETLQVDRLTAVPGENPARAYAEWHVECQDQTSPRHGLRGIHVVEFNEAGLFHRVTVFAHPAK